MIRIRNRAGQNLKLTTQSNYITNIICRKETNITQKETFVGETIRHGKTGGPLGETTFSEKNAIFRISAPSYVYQIL